jgi:hypothetical protein
MNRLPAYTSIGILILLTSALIAADQPNQVDLAVPESPAFTVLGVTPNNVVRPSTGKDLATSLLNGLDQNGNFQTGIALDMLPYLLAVGSKITITEYRASYMTRFVSRVSLSFGTTKGVTDDKSSRLAAGLRLSLFDFGDPRGDRHLETCLNAIRPSYEAALKAAYGTEFNPPDQLMRDKAAADKAEADRKALHDTLKGANETEDAFETRVAMDRTYQAAKLQAVTTKQKLDLDTRATDAANAKWPAAYSLCIEQSRKENANKSSWIVAAAPSWSSPTGINAGMKWDGGGFWTSIAYGFDKVPVLKDTTQLVLHGRYRQKELVQLPGTHTYVRQDSGLGGLLFRVGSPDFALALEGVYVHRQPHGMKVDNSFLTTLSTNIRITDGLWFNLGLGTESGRKNGENRIFLLSQFQWGFAQSQAGVPKKAPSF